MCAICYVSGTQHVLMHQAEEAAEKVTAHKMSAKNRGGKKAAAKKAQLDSDDGSGGECKICL